MKVKKEYYKIFDRELLDGITEYYLVNVKEPKSSFWGLIKTKVIKKSRNLHKLHKYALDNKLYPLESELLLPEK